MIVILLLLVLRACAERVGPELCDSAECSIAGQTSLVCRESPCQFANSEISGTGALASSLSIITPTSEKFVVSAFEEISLSNLRLLEVTEDSGVAGDDWFKLHHIVVAVAGSLIVDNVVVSRRCTDVLVQQEYLCQLGASQAGAAIQGIQVPAQKKSGPELRTALELSDITANVTITVTSHHITFEDPTKTQYAISGHVRVYGDPSLERPPQLNMNPTPGRMDISLGRGGRLSLNGLDVFGLVPSSTYTYPEGMMSFMMWGVGFFRHLVGRPSLSQECLDDLCLEISNCHLHISADELDFLFSLVPALSPGGDLTNTWGPHVPFKMKGQVSISPGFQLGSSGPKHITFPRMLSSYPDPQDKPSWVFEDVTLVSGEGGDDRQSVFSNILLPSEQFPIPWFAINTLHQSDQSLQWDFLTSSAPEVIDTNTQLGVFLKFRDTHKMVLKKLTKLNRTAPNSTLDFTFESDVLLIGDPFGTRKLAQLLLTNSNTRALRASPERGAATLAATAAASRKLLVSGPGRNPSTLVATTTTTAAAASRKLLQGGLAPPTGAASTLPGDDAPPLGGQENLAQLNSSVVDRICGEEPRADEATPPDIVFPTYNWCDQGQPAGVITPVGQSYVPCPPDSNKLVGSGLNSTDTSVTDEAAGGAAMNKNNVSKPDDGPPGPKPRPQPKYSSDEDTAPWVIGVIVAAAVCAVSLLAIAIFAFVKHRRKRKAQNTRGLTSFASISLEELNQGSKRDLTSFASSSLEELNLGSKVAATTSTKKDTNRHSNNTVDSSMPGGNTTGPMARMGTRELISAIFKSGEFAASESECLSHAGAGSGLCSPTTLGNASRAGLLEGGTGGEKGGSGSGPSAFPMHGTGSGDVMHLRLAMQRQLDDLSVGEEQQFEVHSQLGKGAFGVVYKGTWRGLEVAIKRIIFQLLSGAEGDAGRATALREAAINASLNHPNIVTTYSYDMKPLSPEPGPHMGGESSGDSNKTVPNTMPKGLMDWQLYIIQELCERGSLLNAFEEMRFFDTQREIPKLDMVLAIAEDIASGMAYIHSRNIIHGDLKPDNVLLKRRPLTAASGNATTGPPPMDCGQRGGRSAYYSPGLFTFDDCSVPYYAALGKACISQDPQDRPSFDSIARGIRALRAAPKPELVEPVSMPAYSCCSLGESTGTSEAVNASSLLPTPPPNSSGAQPSMGSVPESEDLPQNTQSLTTAGSGFRYGDEAIPCPSLGRAAVEAGSAALAVLVAGSAALAVPMAKLRAEKESLSAGKVTLSVDADLEMSGHSENQPDMFMMNHVYSPSPARAPE
eukprot:gene15533-21624_t